MIEPVLLTHLKDDVLTLEPSLEKKFTNTSLNRPSELRVMSTEKTGETIVEFCTRVEKETGKEALPDPSLGDNLGWYMIHSPIEFQGETFVAEFDVNLSKENVTFQWDEIWIDIPDEDREAILDDVASRIDWTEGEEALYEFRASEDQVPELMQDLRKVHAEVFE